VYATNLEKLDLLDFTSPEDPVQQARVTFPVFNATGAKSTAVVYFELEPGDHVGSHTDSAEEILYIVAGTGLATVGDETAAVDEGTVAVVPALVPHDIVNTGESTLKVLGFFSSNTILSVFENGWDGAGRIVGTPVPEPATAV
jgi:quercetin dioxygenase-like cupin family protein